MLGASKTRNEEECGRTLDMEEDYFVRLATNVDEYAARLRVLSSLAESSHQFHKLVTPLLYKTSSSQKLANMKKSLRTLVKDPRKRGHIKRVVLDPFTAIHEVCMRSTSLRSRGEKWAGIRLASVSAVIS